MRNTFLVLPRENIKTFLHKARLDKVEVIETGFPAEVIFCLKAPMFFYLRGFRFLQVCAPFQKVLWFDLSEAIRQLRQYKYALQRESIRSAAVARNQRAAGYKGEVKYSPQWSETGVGIDGTTLTIRGLAPRSKLIREIVSDARFFARNLLGITTSHYFTAKNFTISILLRYASLISKFISTEIVFERLYKV